MYVLTVITILHYLHIRELKQSLMKIVSLNLIRNDISKPFRLSWLSRKIEKTNKTDLSEAVVTGTAKLDGVQFGVAVMDARFRMGSMGSVVGEKICRIIDYATEHRLPFILFSASGGARMQEGIISLMQMGKTSVSLKRHSDAGLLYISYLTHPTTGGVSASFASVGDINLSEPKALIGFAGRRVIEQTINEKLPDDFQTAEFLLEHGQLDKVVHRKEMKETLAQLLKLHQEVKKMLDFENHFWNKNKIESLKQSQEKMM